MRRRADVWLLAAAAGLAWSCAAATQNRALAQPSGTTNQQNVGAAEWRWSGRLAQGRTIEIKGVNGAVRAEPASGTDVEVIATKRWRRSDPLDVRLVVVEHADGATVCAVYPPPDRTDGQPSPTTADQSNTCQPGTGGRMRTRDNDVRVDFLVRVPTGVRLAARTVNGGIEARAMRGDVVAATVNGRVSVSTTGLASATTVNGSIDVSMGASTWREPLEFKTVNGSITLALPAETRTSLHAQTVNGTIASDLPMTITARERRGRRITGAIGQGGNQDLRLQTVNGGIQLRRAATSG
jgi:hypothetical protein